MADSKTWTTKILFGGRLDSSLTSAASRTNSLLGGVQARAQKMSTTLSTGFNGVGNAFTLIGSKMKGFLLAMGGIGLALAGLSSIKKVAEDSAEAFKEYQANVAKLHAALANNPSIKNARDLEEHQKAIEATAEQMEKLYGVSREVYMSGFTELTTAGAGAREVKKLSVAMADYMAKTHGANVTAEDAVSLAKQIGAAVNTGQLGRWARQLGLTKEQAKAFAQLHTAQQRLDFLNRAMEARAGGQASAAAKTAQGQLTAARSAIHAWKVVWGEGVMRMEAQWTTFLAKIVNGAGTSIQQIIDKFAAISQGIIDVFTDPKVTKAISDLGDSLKPLGDLVASVFKNENIKTATDWLAETIKEFIDSIKELIDTFKKLGEISKPVFDVIAAGFERMFEFSKQVLDTIKKIVGTVGAPSINATEEGWRSYQSAHPGATREQYQKDLEAHQSKADAVRGGSASAGNGGPIRAQAYGPSQGEYSHDQLYDGDYKLQNGDYAVSPDLAAGHYKGQRFQFKDAGGNVHTGVYHDSSFKSPGVPNHNTIEAWNGQDLGSVSELKWLAQGGIFNRATRAIIGEAGPEAVIPLNKSARSLGLLSAASNALGVGRGPTTVNHNVSVVVNGAKPNEIELLGKRVVDSLVRAMKAAEREDFRMAIV